MNNIQEEPTGGTFTQDKYRNLLSQIGNSNSGLDLQTALSKILPVLSKVTGSQNGSDNKVNPIEWMKKLDRSILEPLLEMIQCLHPTEFALAQSKLNNFDNGKEPFDIEGISDWGSISANIKAEPLNSPNMDISNDKLIHQAPYQPEDFSVAGAHPSRYHSSFTSSQMSPINVICSPNHTDSSFRSDFQQQISPEVDPLSPGMPSRMSHSSELRHTLFDSNRTDKVSVQENGRNVSENQQRYMSSDLNFSPEYNHRNSSNTLPSIDRMRTSSPTLDQPVSMSEVNHDSMVPRDVYTFNPASQSTQTSPSKQSSDDFMYTDEATPNGPGAIKIEDQDSFEQEYDSHGLHVTSSGRNRGLGKANEPRFCCQVCGDIAAGFHCGAYVCEACKKFYLRCLKNGGSVAYSCPKTQECAITKETRSHCQFCRYQKCLTLGMYKPGRDDSKHLRVDFKSIPCKVCSAPSSGFHFGAITCEGCKGFFRRMVKEKLHKKFVCTAGGGCDVASSNRTACKACRYQKCLEIGMALEGTRLGRQSNSVKRNTLIQYLNNGMDVALFPKIGESETDDAHTKVDKLLKSSLTDSTGNPQIPDLLPIKQEKEIDEGYGRYINKESNKNNYYPAKNSSHKSSTAGKDYLSDTGDKVNQAEKELEHDTQNIFSFDSVKNHITDVGNDNDPRPFPWSSEKIMSLVDTKRTNQEKRTDFQTFKRKLIDNNQSMDNETSDKHRKFEQVTSLYDQPYALGQTTSLNRTTSVEGNDYYPKLSVNSTTSPVSLDSPISPASWCSSCIDMTSKDPRRCAVEGTLPNRHLLVDRFLTTVPQSDVDQKLPTVRVHDPSVQDKISPLSCNASSMNIHLSGGEGISSTECRDLLLQVIRAYRELEYITKRKRESLKMEKPPQNEKSSAWWAAYESFMHHAKYTLRFVKKIPGFKDLDMEDQITLVRESVYPITLLHHAQFYDPTLKDRGWFCNTADEKRKIQLFFPKFKALETHLEYTGKLFKEMSLSLEENAFICALMVFTIDSFLVKDGEAIQNIQNNLCEAFFAYCTETDTDPNRPGMLILRLAELKRANFEHTQIAIETQRENPDVDFSQLWHEMFLSKINCQ